MMDQSSDTSSHGRVGYGRFARYTPAFLAIVMIAAVAFIAFGDRDKDVSTRDLVGEPSPPLTFIDFETGEVTTLASHAGQVVVLNFWASWCSPCKNEMPAFERVASEGAGDLAIIGIDIKNDKVDDARDLLAELGITYDIAIDSGGEHQLYGPIEQALGLGGTYPVTVFIRADGVIDSIRIGELDETEIRDAIAEARA